MKHRAIGYVIMAAALVSASACAKKHPATKYGHEARLNAEYEYFRSLGDGNYISQDKNWREKLKARESHFHDILKREYMELAKKLEKEKDHTDATFFRRKGLDAGRARFDVMPEDPVKWAVKSSKELEELRISRLDLIDSLVGYAPVTTPIDAARAIVLYDCWVQQSQASSAFYGKGTCRADFRGEYTKLAATAKDIRDKDIFEINKKYNWVETAGTGHKPESKPLVSLPVLEKKEVKPTVPVVPAVAATAPKVTKLPEADGKTSMTYVPAQAVKQPAQATTTQPAVKAPIRPAAQNTVRIEEAAGGNLPDLVYAAYFDKASEALSPSAIAELDKAVEKIKQDNPASVSVNGHTDRSIGASESLAISKKRADAARAYLISKGVKNGIIRSYGFGKTDNLVQNAEGEEKPANNRVEVVFKGKTQ